jgi:hypothetical protein
LLVGLGDAVGASDITVRALASEATDVSGLVTVNVYIPCGIPDGTVADNVVLETYDVFNEPNPSKETTAPLTKSLPEMVIVFSLAAEMIAGVTPIISNAALTTVGNLSSIANIEIIARILIYIERFLFINIYLLLKQEKYLCML